MRDYEITVLIMFFLVSAGVLYHVFADLLSALGLRVYVPFPGDLLLAMQCLKACSDAPPESCVLVES